MEPRDEIKQLREKLNKAKAEYEAIVEEITPEMLKRLELAKEAIDGAEQELFFAACERIDFRDHAAEKQHVAKEKREEVDRLKARLKVAKKALLIAEEEALREKM